MLKSEAPCIVLIDDDLSMAAMPANYLEGEAFAVRHEETGSEGLLLARQHGTVLVLLDVMLSDTDGFSVLQKLRTTSRVPVIMLTMQGAGADRVKELEIGADEYSPHGCSVQFSCKASNSPSFATIEIKDSGSDVPEHRLATIFQPFVRITAGSSASQGTGFGSSMAAEAITLHKGKIWAANLQPGGFLVTIRLPR